MKNKFIVLEGIDNSGKSTISKKLAEILDAKYIQFPDRNSPTGKEINAFLQKNFLEDAKDKTKAEIHKAVYERNMEMQILFSKNRYEKADFIIETLKEKTVVSDRYWISGAVYSTAKGLNYEECKKMDENLPMPDLTFFLDADPEICSKRSGFGEEAHDNLEFQKKVYNIYRNLDEGMIYIKNGSVESMIEEILEYLNK